MTIRPAAETDLAAINDIYTEAVANTTATFDTDPLTPEQRRQWFAHHGGRYPIVVAEDGGRVVGWASVSRYSDKKAYSGTAEVSVYVDCDCRGRGVGRKLLESLVAASRAAGLVTILSRITTENAVSIHLHEALGFSTVGTMRKVGLKFGRYLDVVIMQLVL